MKKLTLSSDSKFILFIGLVYIMHFWHYIGFLAKETNPLYTLSIVLFEVIIFALFGTCMSMSKGKTKNISKMLVFLLAITACTMFWFDNTYGGSELYGIIAALISVILVLKERFVWLILPLWMVVVLISANSLFLFFGLVFAPLYYKVMKTKKYKNILFGLLAMESIGLLYYVCLDKAQLSWMKSISSANLIQLPILIIVTIPYLVFLVYLFKRVIKRSESKADKKLYFVLSLANVLVIPTLFMEQNYGLWMFSAIAYYLVLILVLLAKQDEMIEEELLILVDQVKVMPAGVLLLVYPIAFGPLEWLAIGKAFKLFKLYYGLFM